MLIGYFFSGVSEALKRHQKSRILQSPLGVQIRQYEEAIAAYEDAVKEAERKRLEIQREAEYARQAAERARQAADRAERKKRIDHWQAVRGIQFERELAALYRHLGYDVQSTPKSGDQGIDLILRKGGSTTIVQCKGQKGPASPAVVRELYGSFAAFQGAQHAILACNGGFTQGVYEFAIGNPITLISAKEIARMAEGYSQPQQEQVLTLKNPVPKPSTGRKCPHCGHQMTLYDKFWLCSGFPNCKAIRNTGQSEFTPTTSTTGHGQMGLPTKQPERTTPKKTASQKAPSSKSHFEETTQARRSVNQPESITPRRPISRLPTGPECPSCMSAMALMQLREGGKGKLWGCPRYPECKGARDLNRRVLRY